MLYKNSEKEISFQRFFGNVSIGDGIFGTIRKFGILRVSTVIFILAGQLSFAQIPIGYYDSALGLTGDSLRTALSNIIDGHSEQSYASLWTHFQSTDNISGLVWDMYSDVPSGSPSYIYQFGSDQCGSYTAEGDCFNREHSFPQSWFGSAAPMKSDLFHVYPTDGYVNGQRSNYPYGEVLNPTKTSTNGSKSGPCSYPGYSGIVFEPIDEYKGDFARSYFYMVTRYKNNIASWTSDMLSGDNFSTWANDMLLAWHKMDTVDQKEIDRNDAIYAIQGNRNPYIDMPNFADSIWIKLVLIPIVPKRLINMWVYNGTLHIQNDYSSSIDIEILNMLGQIVHTTNVPAGQSETNLELVNGVFLIQSNQERLHYRLKFMILN